MDLPLRRGHVIINRGEQGMLDDSDGWGSPDWERRQVEAVLAEHILTKQPSYKRLLRAVADAAKDAQDADVLERLRDGIAVVEQIAQAVNEDWWRWYDDEPPDTSPRFWYHDGRPLLIGKKRLEPYIVLPEVQSAAANYLALPYTVPALDRQLVDMLIAAELLAYADEIQHVLKRKLPLVLGWLLNNLASLVVGLAVAGALYWVAPDSTVVNWLAGVVAALTLLGAAWSLIAFPFYYPQMRDLRRKTRRLADLMLDAYVTLNGNPTSTKHLEDRIAVATEAGVVWPSQLIVLVEEIRARHSTI